MRMAVSRACVASFIATLAACAAPEPGPAIPAGTYELQATVGAQTFPVRLELLPVDDGPWGRLTVVADGRWTFVAGGPVRTLQLGFDDEVSGTISIGDRPPIALDRRRTGDVAAAEALRSHHALDPLGLAHRAGEVGASFPTGTPDGALLFARHGPDLSRQTLMFAAAAAQGDVFRVDPRGTGLPAR
jgi:hypothetical protein